MCLTCQGHGIRVFISDGGIRLAATDLAHFLSCRHLTALELMAARKVLERPRRKEDPLIDLMIQRGNEHEAAYVDALRHSGRDVVRIPKGKAESAVAQTVETMRGGADIIVQGALQHDQWFGYADILLRVDTPSELGAFAYEAADTKLARETRATTILQLGLYSFMLEAVQGTTPEHFHVVVPGPGRDSPAVTNSYRVNDFSAYVRLIQRELAAAADGDHEALAGAHYPDPVEHCEVCGWWHRCNEKRRADDHLSLVAGLGRLHRRELEANGFGTLARLAELPVPLEFRPRRGSRASYERAREQALVQLRSRDQTAPVYTLRPPEPPPKDPTRPVERRGFERLPEPSPGDVFLDLEGDLFAAEGGREYLFGITTVEPDGSAKYRAWWGFTAHEERLAFESVMDFITERLERDPGMHVYHYAPYEPSAFKRLMGRHATREQELDRLLRGRLFIDLYAVVRQAMWVGVESYSIKRLEPAYGFTRDVNLPDASHALRRMELALQLNRPDLAPDEDRALIEGYNRDDCVSTLRLRDWLEVTRAEAIVRGIPCDRPPREPDEPAESVTDEDLAVRALRARLLVGVPDENRTVEEEATWLLAYLLDYHRREDKATWWEYFRLRDLVGDDLLDERDAVAGLAFVKRVDDGEKNERRRRRVGVVDRYSYPEQEMDIDARATLKMPGDGKDFGKAVAVDRINRTIDIKKSRPKAEVHPSALFAFEYIDDDVIRDSIFALGQRAAQNGFRSLASSAASDLLLRSAPRLRSAPFARRPDESEVEFAIRCGHDLDRSVLAIQGPPGAGKTYTGSRMIASLIAAGRRVGVTANSHKVIAKLLKEACDAAAKAGTELRAGHLGGRVDVDGDGKPIGPLVPIADNDAAIDAITIGTIQVLGGTAWMWSRPEFASSVDVLFVDEAGQMALANAIAVSRAAESLVLLGDPQQLDQPTKASHPDGVAVPALTHVLGPHQTIPADRGIFLPLTWRMSPALCRLTSELYYEGRLASKPGLEHQVLVNAGDLSGSGYWYADVDHDGNRNHSPEEVETIAALVARLTTPGVLWQDESGVTRPVGLEDILIVSPYNSQVNRIAERLDPGAHVGTVDRFQGQEAPVVIYSMATSRPEDAPRGLEFLYNPNRLNVATSRARCAVILVASPHLFQPECRSVRQIKLANGLCRYRELAVRLVL